jgi:hypothetical protein
VSRLTAIHVARTGHVLAALTRTTEPPANEQASTLVGTGLPVRFTITPGAAAPPEARVVTVPADLLAATTVADGAAVFDDPRAFQVVEAEHNGERVTELQGFADTATLTVTTSTLTVAAASAGAVARPVAVVLEQPGDRVVRESAIPAGGSSVALPVALAPGKWLVAALVAGHAPMLDERTVP